MPTNVQPRPAAFTPPAKRVRKKQPSRTTRPFVINPSWRPIVREYIGYCQDNELYAKTTLSITGPQVDHFVRWTWRNFKVLHTNIERVHVEAFIRAYLRGTKNEHGARHHDIARKYPSAARMLKTINAFGRWMVQMGHSPGFAATPLSFSEYRKGPGRRAPDAIKPFAQLAVPGKLDLDDPEGVARSFAADQVMNEMSERYAETCAHTVKRFLQWAREFHEVGAGGLTRQHIAEYVQMLKTTPARHKKTLLSPNTVKRNFQQLRTFSRWLYAAGIQPENLTRGMKGPRGLTVFVAPPPDELIEAILEARHGRSEILRRRNHLVVVFLAFTGVRIAELLSLDRAAVQGKTVITVRGKGARERTIGLHPRVRAAVRDYLAMRRDQHPALLVSQDDHRLTHLAVRQMFDRFHDKFGIPIKPHAFRRWHFTSMARAGQPWFVIKAAGGWSNTSSAERYIWQAAKELAMDAQSTFDPFARGYEAGAVQHAG